MHDLARTTDDRSGLDRLQPKSDSPRSRTVDSNANASARASLEQLQIGEPEQLYPSIYCLSPRAGARVELSGVRGGRLRPLDVCRRFEEVGGDLEVVSRSGAFVAELSLVVDSIMVV